MSAVSVLGTISCLADRAVDAVSVSSHWVFSRCVRSRALGDVMASAYLQDSKVLSPECGDSVLAAGNPDGRRGKGGDEVGKWRLKRQVQKVLSVFSRHGYNSSRSRLPPRMCAK